MSQGLQIWDSSGNLVLDTNTRLAQWLGQVSSGGNNGSVTDNELLRGTPYYYVRASVVGAFAKVPAITISGSTITWTYPAPKAGFSSAPVVITYGVF
jgi:hypothetical protein